MVRMVVVVVLSLQRMGKAGCESRSMQVRRHPVRGQKRSGQYETDLHANHHNNVALVDTHCCRRVVKPYPGEIRIHVTG